MGLYNMLTTSASGMSAQSALLNTVSDNIANASTVGYKKATVEFSTLVLNTGLTSDYQSGSVDVDPIVQIDGQGPLQSSTTTTNLAIKGNGYFIVEGSDNTPLLTRAGAFVENSSGELVNTAGYKLMGYAAGTTGVANGYSGLVPVNVGAVGLRATPTTSGELYVNLPSNDPAVAAANLPSANVATPAPGVAHKTSLSTYDNLGNEVKLDVYMTNMGGNKWDVAVYNQADAPTAGGFPYSSAALATSTLTFNSTTGALVSATPASPTSPTSLAIPIPNGGTMTLDMSQATQLAGAYTILTASANGNAPSQVSGVSIGTDGSVSVTYQNGSSSKLYDIPLATVASPNLMTVVSGNAYLPNQDSGKVQIGTASSGGMGAIKSSTLEGSTVDLASELTTMIAAQNNYEANSKVFNTGSQLLQVLINLGK